jgi:hypothetical protein
VHRPGLRASARRVHSLGPPVPRAAWCRRTDTSVTASTGSLAGPGPGSSAGCPAGRTAARGGGAPLPSPLLPLQPTGASGVRGLSGVPGQVRARSRCFVTAQRLRRPEGRAASSLLDRWREQPQKILFARLRRCARPPDNLRAGWRGRTRGYFLGAWSRRVWGGTLPRPYGAVDEHQPGHGTVGRGRLQLLH